MQSTPPLPAHPPDRCDSGCVSDSRNRGEVRTQERTAVLKVRGGVDAFETSRDGARLLVGRRAEVALGKVAARTGTSRGNLSELTGEGGRVAGQSLASRGLSAFLFKDRARGSEERESRERTAATHELFVVGAVGADGGRVDVARAGSEVAVTGRAELVKDGVVLGVGDYSRDESVRPSLYASRREQGGSQSVIDP